jgi:sortase A
VKRLRRAGLLLLLAAAAWHAGHAALVEVKARLAQQLVRAAWQRTKAGEADGRPWPWADTRPIARLVVPALRLETFILAGASGRTLAFGPGHVDGTARPGESGNAVVSGHRDTHFAFLRRLREGDAVLVERRDGQVRHYVVSGARVVDRRDRWVASGAFDDTRLTLVTCYPFDALRPGGPLRYVVTARLADAPVSGTLTGPPRDGRRPSGFGQAARVDRRSPP